jgi:hypothetical protein
MNRYKHADLRLCNMIFDVNEAHLIDFDFSRKGTLLYLICFVNCLLDVGLRAGKELEFVSATDDADTFCEILRLFESKESEQRKEFYNLSIEIDTILENSIKNFHEGYKANAKVCDRAQDDAECKIPFSFLTQSYRFFGRQSLK